MNFAQICAIRDQNLTQDNCDLRISELLNIFEGFYKNTLEIEALEMLEKIFVRKIYDYVKLRLTMDASLKMLQILQNMAIKTTSNENFAAFIEFFVLTITSKDGVRDFANMAHYNLFILFSHYYLVYPPFRLMQVLKAFTSILSTGYKEVKMLTLKFLATLGYDHNYQLYTKNWGIPSYLCGLDIEEFNFPSQTIISAVCEFLRIDLDLDIILAALDVLISLCQGHYGLNKVNLHKLIEVLAQFQLVALNQKELDICLKVIDLLQIIVTQKNVDSDAQEMQIVLFALPDIVSIFTCYLNQLRVICNFCKADIEEFKKSKNFKKIANSPARCKILINKI